MWSLPEDRVMCRYQSAVCLGPIVFSDPDAFGFIQWFAYHVDVVGIDHVYVYLVQPRKIPAAAARVLSHYHGRGRATLINWSPIGDVWGRTSWHHMQVCPDLSHHHNLAEPVHMQGCLTQPSPLHLLLSTYVIAVLQHALHSTRGHASWRCSNVQPLGLLDFINDEIMINHEWLICIK
jgi:hypothetical protein